MSASSPTPDEIRDLADTMFDGEIDQASLQRLDELILTQQPFAQAYLELINFHGELFCQANFYSDEHAALSVLQEFSRACERQERRRWRRDRRLTISAACLAVFCGLCSWFFLARLLQPTPLGSVAFLTNNASLKTGNLELGDILHKGKTISINEGMVSIQLQNVLIDLVAPAELKFQTENQVQLVRGALTALVLPGGEGFSVRTPDAEIVDRGTEFSVQYDVETGTDVTIRRGRAQISLMNTQGQPTKMLELTAHRSAQLRRQENTMKEVEFRPEAFALIDDSRGGICRLDGNVRIAADPFTSFLSNRAITPNHLLIVPERQNLQLDADLVLNSIEGQIRIPAGAVVSTYLMHFDPGSTGFFAPRGAITFFAKIAAVVGTSAGLTGTDTLFGLEKATYELETFRELELDEDEIRISEDRKSLSFFFGASPPQFLDEARIFIVNESP